MSETMEFATQSCTGCRTCELACSYHHRGVFRPSTSSIRIKGGDQLPIFSVVLYLEDNNGHLACDGCRGLEEPLCVKYCNVVGREELNGFLQEFKKKCSS